MEIHEQRGAAGSYDMCTETNLPGQEEKLPCDHGLFMPRRSLKVKSPAC